MIRRLGSLDTRAQQVVDAIGAMSPSTLRRWVLLGLLVRLALSPLYGTQDMEWWKAWGSYAVTQGVTRVYGAADDRIVAAWREGRSVQEILDDTQAVIAFEPYRYFRTEYRVLQPPLYVYSLYASTRAYQWVSPTLENRRWFNVFINLQPIAASAILAWVIASFVGTTVTPEAGRLAGLLYWLNPLVLLNAPVQAYQDPLCVLFGTLSVIAVYRRQLPTAVVCLVLAALTKPQGILVLPVVVMMGLLEHRPLKNIAAWMAGAVAGLLVCVPYLMDGRLLSMILGVLSIGQASTDLTRQALNLWWPLQYAWNAAAALSGGPHSVVAAVGGGVTCWQCDVPAARLTATLGFPVAWVGFGLLLAFTVANLLVLRAHVRQNRRVILTAAALQVYAYFMLRVGVQVNHYFMVMPLLALALTSTGASVRLYAWVSALFLAQDLIFYGLGRDLNVGVNALSRLSAGWITVVIAAANLATFVWLSWRHFRHGSGVPPPRVVPAQPLA